MEINPVVSFNANAPGDENEGRRDKERQRERWKSLMKETNIGEKGQKGTQRTEYIFYTFLYKAVIVGG